MTVLTNRMRQIAASFSDSNARNVLIENVIKLRIFAFDAPWACIRFDI